MNSITKQKPEVKIPATKNGELLVAIKDGDANQSMVECFLGDDVCVENYAEALLCKDQPKCAYVIQGQVILVNKITGNFEVTTDTACAQTSDLLAVFVINENASSIENIRRLR